MSGGRRLLAGPLVALLGAALFSPVASALSPRATSAPAVEPAIAAPTLFADPASEEAQFIALTNQLRASKGLSTLAVSGEVTAVARRWAGRMAAAGAISHNSNLPNEVSLNWTKLGENVGVGGTVQAIQDAFIKSPTHYKNLVDPVWNYVGIGVVDSAGRIWVTVNFMQLPGSAAPAAPAAPAPRAAPRTTSPPRTPAPAPAPARPTPTTLPPRPAPAPAASTAPPPAGSPALTLAIDQLRAIDH